MNKPISFLTILLFLNSWGVLAQNPIAYWNFDETEGIATKEVITDKSLLTFSNWSPIERIAGVKGNALRLDGYSTFVEGTIEQVLPANELTLSVWVALESYPVGNGMIFNQFESSTGKGIYLGFNKFGNLISSVHVNGVARTLDTDFPLERGKWQQITFVVSPSSELITLYLNGEKVAERSTSNGIIEYPNTNKVQIGLHSVLQKDGTNTYNLNQLNGVVDELAIYEQAFSLETIETLYNQDKPSETIKIKTPETRFSEDPNRPIFHAIPDAAWTNEPHGLVFYNGEYRMFYQKNANGPYFGQQNWGYMSSPDLLRWTDHLSALSPNPGWESVGNWSGDAVVDDDGQLQLLYTGVDGVKAGMGLATANETVTAITRFPQNPIIRTTPPGLVLRDFRDPYLFKYEGQWMMIIGSGVASSGSGGTVLLYKAIDNDLSNWEYLRAMYSGRPEQDDAGIFWEMPVFMQFGEKWVLLVNKVPEPGRRAQALYWVGTFDGSRFTPDNFDITPKKLEIINNLLSPTITKDPQGRYVGIGIVPDEVSVAFQEEAGWAHLYTLPRIYDLSEDGILIQKPLPELERFRGAHQRLENISINAGEENFTPTVQGRHLELKATIDPNGVREFGMYLLRAEDQTEQTRFYYDFNTQLFWTDRSRSTTNTGVPRGQQTGKYEFLNRDEPFELQVFIDGSIVEVFIDNQATFSFRAFPEGATSTGIDFYAKGGSAIIQSLDVWQMNDMENITVSTNEVEVIPQKKIVDQFYPNPFKNEVIVDLNLPQRGDLQFRVYDIGGKLVDYKSFGQLTAGKQQITWQPQNTLASGTYLVELLLGENKLETLKVVKN